MNIRNATREDIPLLSKLNVEIQQMHADHVPGFFKVPESEDFAEGFYAMMLDKDNTHIFIAEEDGQAVGSMITHTHRWDENWFNYANNILFIDHISVQEAYRGKGCGRALMARAEKLAQDKNLAYIVLDTWGFNTGAQAFYQALGYDTAYIRMWRKLDQE